MEYSLQKKRYQKLCRTYLLYSYEPSILTQSLLLETFSHIVSLFHPLNVQKSVEATCSIVRSRESIPHRHGRDGTHSSAENAPENGLAPLSLFCFQYVFSHPFIRMAAQKNGEEHVLELASQAERHAVLSVGTSPGYVQIVPTKYLYTFLFTSPSLTLWGEGDQSKNERNRQEGERQQAPASLW